ncbi:transcription factor Rlm1p [Monosporozyma unispora]
MGRRKIEIEPITDERNRTVTFIKRKAGLFKKAHELAVLCQVDVTLLILGHNNTFYEFSSVDTNDMLNHYNNDKHLLHDSKDPSFYGNEFKQKKFITLNKLKNNHLRSSSNNNIIINNNNNNNVNDSSSDDEEEIADTHTKGHKRNNSKRKLLSISDNNDHHLNKKFRIELNNNNNTNKKLNNNTTTSHIQNRVQNKFQDLHNKTVLSNIITDNNKLPTRPVLRVQIPQNNIIGGDTIKSEPSSTNPNVYGNTSPQHYKKISSDKSKRSNTVSPINNDQISSLTLQKNIIKSKDTNKNTLKLTTNTSANGNNNFSFTGGLPPLSAMSPYIATPLQSSNFHPTTAKINTSTHNINPTSPLIANRTFQQQTHAQRYTQQISNRSSSPLNSTYTSQDNTTLQPGNLPSKYVNDLMIPSPTVFQDWNFSMNNNNNNNNNTSATTANGTNKFVVPTTTTLQTNNNVTTTTTTTTTTTNNNNNNTTNYDPSNGNTGLTPYIGMGQTPLTNRFFNFPTSDINSPDQDKKNVKIEESSSTSLQIEEEDKDK